MFCKKDDFERLCDEIARILGDAEASGSLRQNAGRFVASLGWDAVVGRYLPLLRGS